MLTLTRHDMCSPPSECGTSRTICSIIAISTAQLLCGYPTKTTLAWFNKYVANNTDSQELTTNIAVFLATNVEEIDASAEEGGEEWYRFKNRMAARKAVQRATNAREAILAST